MIAEWLHEGYEFVDPGHVPGAMTDSPILVDSDGTFVADNGQTVITESACVFWFPNYMVQCPWETLRNRGRVEFDRAAPYESPVSPPVPPGMSPPMAPVPQPMTLVATAAIPASHM